MTATLHLIPLTALLYMCLADDDGDDDDDDIVSSHMMVNNVLCLLYLNPHPKKATHAQPEQTV